MWMKYETYLKNFYWGTRQIWTRGYFCGSVGNISADQVEQYLESRSQNLQGQEDSEDDE
jgi:REP element-mobilizing transposase RayT